MPSPGTEGIHRGYLIPIGGAEQKKHHKDILDRFVRICGTKDANIVVIPTASELEDTGQTYVDIFQKMGVDNTSALHITNRAEAQSSQVLDALEQATGIFITGGNQLRLSTILGGTPVAQSLRRLNSHGTHIAGTSAGAAIMSEHMIASGDKGGTPKQGSVSLCPGLGLTNSFIIDQHFRQRDRLGRLMSAISYNPFLVGLGLDEDTAAFIDPEGIVHVEGSGAITIVDPRELEYSGIQRTSHGDSISMIGMRVHLLTKGCTYDPAMGTAAFPK